MKDWVFLTLFIVSALSIQLQGQNKVLQAGAAQVEITPPLGTGIYGNWVQPAATTIHDPLHAKALVLDDGVTPIALVVADLCETNGRIFDMAKKWACEEVDLKTDNIMISVTHTHSGPDSYGNFYIPEEDALPEYALYLARKFADCIITAYHNMEPAKIAWDGIDIPEHVFVRRWIMKDSVYSPYGTKEIVRMNPGNGNPNLVRPSGPVDPELSFISVQSIDGRPISVFANYSLHYVGGVPSGEISADYFGLFGMYMERMLTSEVISPRFVGIMSNGTSGNINNIDFTKERENHPPYQKMQMVAKDIAEKVYKKIQILEHKSWVPTGVRHSMLPIDIRRARASEMAKVARIQARPDSVEPYFSKWEKMFAHRIYRSEATWPSSIDIPLQALQIGDLCIAALPFEAFTQTGLEIKSKSPFDDTFVVGLANAYYEYLPTPEEVDYGGYEAWLSINRVEKQASVKITDELLRLINGLKK